MRERDIYNEPMEDNNLPDSLRVTPFSTPNDFFIKQKESILTEISVFQSRTLPASDGYSLPKDYFEQLEESILIKKSEIRIKEQATFSADVPQGYFENLEHSILAQISEIKLKETIIDDGFAIPTDYFSSLEKDIATKRSEEALKSKVPSDGYSIPTDYFNALSDKINSTSSLYRNDNGTKAKTIAINKGRNWINYISAAALLFLIGFGSYFTLKQASLSNSIPRLQTNSTQINLGEVSDEEILEYLAQVSEGEELMHLTKFIEQEDTANQNHIDNTIADEDIKEYLNYML
ncbi:hypothetical protein [Sphingobacterium paucimobilis]|uniref:Uncharacterized protein n=1 Tax=Sphingobacterium paucimobilis HER1398 TaxID=1346330 RepID=U2HGA1_9SPHI|nr:hypothetical protein [Sphingobacterium paucimobilis]ERJ60786.1 hypothetical protein M472_18700 [Sphingobacterium paucimobilis HER1398]